MVAFSKRFSQFKVRFSIVMATKKDIENESNESNESNELDLEDDSNESNHSHNSYHSRHSRQSSTNRAKRKLKHSSAKEQHEPHAKKPRHNSSKQRYHLASQADRIQTSDPSRKPRIRNKVKHNKHKHIKRDSFRRRSSSIHKASIAPSPKLSPIHSNERMFLWYPCTVYQ